MPDVNNEFRVLAQQWDERYAATDRVFRAVPNEMLAELVSAVSPGSAIDLGSGEGRNSLWLAGQGWSVTAVDASQVGLEKLNSYAQKEGLNVETVVGDLWEFMETTRSNGPKVDLVVLAYIQVVTAERSMLLDQAASLLKPGGHLFVVAHHLDSLGHAGPPDPQRLFIEDDLARIQGVTIDRLELLHGPSDVPESGTDVFLWATRNAER